MHTAVVVNNNTTPPRTILQAGRPDKRGQHQRRAMRLLYGNILHHARITGQLGGTSTGIIRCFSRHGGERKRREVLSWKKKKQLNDEIVPQAAIFVVVASFVS